eukprot:SAG31_NODE_3993_length_3679_cov_2.781006_2_plen_113_part_00
MMPDSLSPELKDLLSSMLDPNPKTRASIRTVACHQWVVNGADAHCPLARAASSDKAAGSAFNDQAVDDVVGFGFDRQTVEAALLADKRNSITSAYRLAVQQRWLALQRSGGF